jgi:hypothetical protein
MGLLLLWRITMKHLKLEPIHIDELSAHGMLPEAMQRFGLTPKSIFPLDWWLQLPTEFVTKIYEHLSEERITIRSQPKF